MRRIFGKGGLAGHRQLDLLAAQLTTVDEGLSVVRALTQGELTVAEARERIGVVEHEGDDDRARLVDTLARSLVTPIDREDVFRLSRSIDDVLDGLRDFVREVDLFQAGHLEQCTPLVDDLAEGVAALDRAVGFISKSAESAGQEVLAARKAGNRVHRGYQQRVAELLNRDLGADTLRELEVLRTLERVRRYLAESADALADGVMKRWS